MSSPTQTDAELDRLVERCRNHDAAAQTALRNRYRAGVLRAIRRYLRRCRAARDLDEDVAATFWLELFYRKPWRLRAYRSERGGLGAYLTGIAWLTTLDYLLVERRERLVTLPMATLDRFLAPSSEIETRAELELLLPRLSDADRALLFTPPRYHVAPPDARPDGGMETREAARLRQRKKRLVHKVLQILGLRHGAEALEKKPKRLSQTAPEIRE
ncbi:MAG: hypothetical protein L0191_13580 [Acidobacteria bacterium]|nr:hypothetical protein [Acidobacteriota bacterium]